MKLTNKVVLFALFFSALTVYAAEKADIIVAQDGSGDFKIIQEALNSISASNDKNITILVKNGVYIEHLFIEKSHISIIGEDREKTIIQYAINRDNWNKEQGTNSGSGVIAIGVKTSDSTSTTEVTDIVIGNLTVENTYKSYAYKTHVIRSEGLCTRIWVVHCNVWCKGHDTIALWDKNIGMYYHTDCSFKGSIDAVCPRAWCYAVACDFYETTSSAPIWHEGELNTTQKFVVRTGRFMPDSGNSSSFKLLNGQKENKFYLLDAILSPKVTTSGTYNAAYFHNCHGQTSDLNWFKDNLSSAPGSPTQDKITAKWTFDNKWDPEGTMPAALPYAALPRPWNKAYEVEANTQLQWARARNAEKYAVYFGKENPPSFVKTQSENSYTAPAPAEGRYFWRIDAVGEKDTVAGATWSFTVGKKTHVKHPDQSPAKNKQLFTATVNNGTSVTFNYTITARSLVNLNVVNLQGKEVFSEPEKVRNPGAYSESFRMHFLPSGAYIARLRSESRTEEGKIVIP